MNEQLAFERELGRTQSEASGSQDSASILSLLSDRMHGRWKWAVALGLAVGGALATVGFRMAAVTYSARGLVQVEQDLPEILIETPETAQIQNFTAYIGTQAALMRDGRVLADAVRSDELQSFLPTLGEDPEAVLAEDLDVSIIRGTDLISIEYTSEDRRLAQAAANAVLDSYFRIYGPNAETTHTRTTQQVRVLLSDARRQLSDFALERERIESSSEVSSLAIGGESSPIILRAARLQEELANVEELQARIAAEAAAEGRVVAPNDVAAPTDSDLLAADPGLVSLLEAMEESQSEVNDLSSRLSEQHPQMRQATRRLQVLEDSVAKRRESLRSAWSVDMRDRFSFGALGSAAEQLQADLAEEREKIDRYNQEQFRLQTIDRESELVRSQIQVYESRLRGLETESDVIRQGRVTIRARAQLPTGPSRDRRVQYSLAGFVGGLGVSMVGFFLLGSLDRRAFASRQLESDQSRFLPLGVVPDMSRLGDSDEERVLLEDCVHRVRNRIEVRRAHTDRGFAINVSSPFQGDGKTSVAAALAWSYAQAGYRTVMVDADFIGRALSAQFGVLGEVGVREALRDPEAMLAMVREGRPNLDILPVGRDREVSAGHLQPAAMRTLLTRLRDHYEVVVVDSGPMTASVESLPIIGAVDAVILVLRRGRNRNRLAECIADITNVGVSYLGVVLNYATLADCQRYSSLSRTSSDLESGTDDSNAAGPSHPVVAALGSRSGPKI